METISCSDINMSVGGLTLAEGLCGSTIRVTTR